MNRLEIMVILESDPELRVNRKGRAVCTLRVRTESKRSKNLYHDRHTVLVWGSRAEELPLQIVKGSRLLINGKLGIQHWQYGGKTYTKTIILAESVQVLTGFQSELFKENFRQRNMQFPNS